MRRSRRCMSCWNYINYFRVFFRDSISVSGERKNFELIHVEHLNLQLIFVKHKESTRNSKKLHYQNDEFLFSFSFPASAFCGRCRRRSPASEVASSGGTAAFRGPVEGTASGSCWTAHLSSTAFHWRPFLREFPEKKRGLGWFSVIIGLSKATYSVLALFRRFFSTLTFLAASRYSAASWAPLWTQSM